MASTVAQTRLVEALEQHDLEQRQARAARIEWASEHDVTRLGVISGVPEMMSLMSETRECFVNGHFIATLMLGTAVIEHVIVEELVDRGIGRFRMPLSEALAIARKEQVFPESLLDAADKLRALRNPFAHRRPDDDNDRFSNRYIARKTHPRVVLEEDARVALASMYACVRHVLRRV